MRAKIPLFFFMEATFHFENLIFTSDQVINPKSIFNTKENIPVIYQDADEIF